MNSLFAIMFGFPSVVVLAVLSFIAVYDTMLNIWIAIRIKDFVYLYAVLCVTIVAAIFGWILGGQLG